VTDWKPSVETKFIMQDAGLGSGLLMFVVLLLGGGFALTLTRNNQENLRVQRSLFVCAFVLRFAASILLYQFGLVNVLKDEDASGWAVGRDMQAWWLQHGVGLADVPGLLVEGFQPNNRGYFHYSGVLFLITGMPYRLPAAAVNCCFGALTVVFVYRIARNLFGRTVAVRAGWLACLFPSLIIWSAQTLKEPVVILLETVALYGCTQLIRSGFSARHVLVTILAIVLMIPFRFYAAYIAIIVVVIAISVPRVGGRVSAQNSRVVVWALMIPVLALTGFMLQKEAQLERFNLDYVDRFRESAAKEASGVRVDTDLRTPTGFTVTLLVGVLHLMLAPFPWQLAGGSLRMLLVGPELLLWWWIFFVGVLPGLRYSLRYRLLDVLPVLFFVVGLGLLYSLMFSNVGLIYRQRAQLLPYLLIFGAVGLQLRFLRQRKALQASSPVVATSQ
jgi:hypothetical protein